MPNPDLTRRRMIAIVATAAGSAFLTGGRTVQAGDPVRWHGSALGAQVSIEIYHPDRAEALRLVDRCVLDVRRLEQQFSLYRTDSDICALNRTGILVSPDADMVALLEASLLFADLTDGAFDPTVQPLWQLYADHFSSERPEPDGPSPRKLAETLAKVGRGGLLVSADRIALVKRGAAITLNGIAQGYATDRVVERRSDDERQGERPGVWPLRDGHSPLPQGGDVSVEGEDVDGIAQEARWREGDGDDLQLRKNVGG